MAAHQKEIEQLHREIVSRIGSIDRLIMKMKDIILPIVGREEHTADDVECLVLGRYRDPDPVYRTLCANIMKGFKTIDVDSDTKWINDSISRAKDIKKMLLACLRYIDGDEMALKPIFEIALKKDHRRLDDDEFWELPLRCMETV